VVKDKKNRDITIYIGDTPISINMRRSDVEFG
jgi:hypothetical protein